VWQVGVFVVVCVLLAGSHLKSSSMSTVCPFENPILPSGC
jgi:hypothetical protein